MAKLKVGDIIEYTPLYAYGDKAILKVMELTNSEYDFSKEGYLFKKLKISSFLENKWLNKSHHKEILKDWVFLSIDHLEEHWKHLGNNEEVVELLYL